MSATDYFAHLLTCARKSGRGETKIAARSIRKRRRPDPRNRDRLDSDDIEDSDYVPEDESPSDGYWSGEDEDDNDGASGEEGLDQATD